MSKAIFCQSMDCLHEFLRDSFPSMPDKEKAALFGIMCAILRSAIYELAEEWIKRAAETSRN